MARDIDRVIECVHGLERDRSLSPVMAQVIINRIDFAPTQAEIARARDQVMGRSTVSVNR